MIDATVDVLRQKKLILYPTDTVWGVGGDATDPKVVEKVYRLKRREDHKALIVLVAHRDMLESYVDSFPEEAIPFLEDHRPTTVIYPKGVGLATNLLGEDFSIGIRIPKHSFCQKVIEQFGKPIISTSANISGEPTPHSFEQIASDILEGVDYIVPLRETSTNQPSRVVKIDSKGAIHILRP